MERELMTIQEVSDYLQLSKNSVRFYILNHSLPAIKLRRIMRVRKSDLLKWLKDNEVAVKKNRKEDREKKNQKLWEAKK